jgi:hypothetical protein
MAEKKSRRTISRQILCLFHPNKNIHDKDKYGHKQTCEFHSFSNGRKWQKVAEWMAVNLLAIAPSLTSSAPDVDDYTAICSLSPANYYTKLYVLRILLHL